MRQEDKIFFRKKWADTFVSFDMMINNGLKLRPIRFLIRHIIESGYDSRFFPGSSMYSLLISLPKNGKVDYTRTLCVNIDQSTSKVHFDYFTGDRERRNLKWSTSCELTEINDIFEYFLIIETAWN